MNYIRYKPKCMSETGKIYCGKDYAFLSDSDPCRVMNLCSLINSGYRFLKVASYQEFINMTESCECGYEDE